MTGRDCKENRCKGKNNRECKLNSKHNEEGQYNNEVKGNKKGVKILKIALVLTILIALLGGICYYEVYISYNNLAVNTYDIDNDKISSPIKFVMLGDLHDSEFGEANEELVSIVKKQNPDFIILNGDIINGDSENSDIAIGFTKKMVEIAPVYYAIGNHEIEYIQSKNEDLIAEIEATGAVFLENEYKDIEVNGVDIRIGGMYAYAFDGNGEVKRDKMADGIYDFLRDFEDTDSYKIMMSHRPDSFIFGQASKVWNIDLIASAHNHGGQVIFPFLGGFYGGDQGYFPEYTHGVYDKDNLKLVITSGLGSNDQKLPRFNNVPEVMVVNLR